ncbi:MAG: ABC transporter substrate-binding protein [Treponema sp.]|jgi:branched-chain amino acid transport system substrate-binding protein|nr:ABC transporter substrate-binding protein [Treponema sp.]
MKKIILLFSIVFFLSINCKNDASDRSARYNLPKSNEISIGVAYPVMLKTATDTHFAKGIDFAVSIVNKNGGILGKQLTTIIRDDRNNANVAMQIAQAFCDQGITAVIGHWSTNISYYTEDIYESNKVVMLTPRSTGLVLFEEKFNYVFRMPGSNLDFAQAIASDITEKGYKNVAMYFSEDEFGVDYAKITEKKLNARGIRVIDRISSITPLNIETIQNRWNAFGCEAVVVAATYPDHIEPIKIIRRSSLELPIYVEDSFESATLTDLPDNHSRNIFIVTLDHANLDSAFLEGFILEYGHAPDTPAVNGYEAVMLLADAMQTVQSIDGTAIAEYISNLKEYKTVSSIRAYNHATQEFDGYNIRIHPLEDLIFRKYLILGELIPGGHYE